MSNNQGNGKKRKLRKRENARKVKDERKGYWGCENCFVHNRNSLFICHNCGSSRPNSEGRRTQGKKK